MIREALVTDDGVYICNATNKFGSDVRNGTLAVKQKTRIQTPPADQEVRRGYSALFRCTASSDKSLSHDIDWYKDGRLLSYTGAVNFNLCVGGVRRAGRLGRFIKDTLDKNTLKIVDVQFDDAGAYVCRASTEVDFDEATAALVVQDRPNRPKITKVNCSESAQNVSGQASAVVQWEAAGSTLTREIMFVFQHRDILLQAIITLESSTMNCNTIRLFSQMIGHRFPLSNDANRLMKSNHLTDPLNWNRRSQVTNRLFSANNRALFVRSLQDHASSIEPI